MADAIVASPGGGTKRATGALAHLRHQARTVIRASHAVIARGEYHHSIIIAETFKLADTGE